MFILAHRIGTGLEGLLLGTRDDSKGREDAGRLIAGCGETGWVRVVFADECEGHPEEGCICPQCGDYYAECECPGPTQDGYEYAEFDGVLYARPEQAWPSRPGEQQFAWEPPRVLGNASGKRSQRQSCGEFCESKQEQQSKRSDGNLANSRQTQPSMGRDAHGPADWMDNAQLFATCDNRIDELRLLGNGVVPATAERAFRVLIKELA